MSKKKLIKTEGEDASAILSLSEPIIVNITLQGTSDMIFHRWNAEEVDAKAAAPKASKQKRTDNLESYVYRDNKGMIALPGEYVRQSIIHAAKYKQDPRSTRKSAMDLYKAGIVCLTPLASLGCEKWHYEDKRRVVIQRSAINRIRPAITSGWTADFQFMINTPEYIRKEDFIDTLATAGRLVGLADFRPTYGRFVIKSFD